MGYTFGVDLGGTNIVVGLLDPEYNLLRKLKRPTEAKQGEDAVLAKIADMANELLGEAGLTMSDVDALGAGIPGFVDPEAGICQFAGNLSWRNVPVADKLSDKLGIPVFIDNDVRMYTMGEAEKGAGRGFNVVFGVTLGTGIAAGLVVNGQFYYGSGNIAGEIGHIRMEGENSLCGCGLTGCLETIVSANGLARLAREKIAEGRASLLERLAPRPEEIKAAHISEAYDQGDPVAIEVMAYAGKMLGKGLSYALTLLNPDVVVIGGGAANAGERLFAPMRAELKKLVLPQYWEQVTIKQAELLDDAGVIGSAVQAGKRLAKSR